MLTRTLPASERAAAGALWQALEARVGHPGLACSWAWTDTWLAAYGDVVPHRFVVGVLDGEDVAMALVTEGAERYPRVVGARTAHIGTAGEPRGEGVFVERNRLLVAGPQRAAFAGALLAHVGRDRRWDRLVVPGLHPDDAAALQAADAGVVLEPRGSPVADLVAGQDPLALLASRPRRRVRRALDGLAPLATEWATTVGQGHAVMDELIELHQKRWEAAGESGSFANARFVAFHRALIDRLGPGRGVVLVRVRDGAGATAGCVYGQVEGRDVLFYQSGLRRYADNKLNAGLAVHMCAMRACAEHGLEAYDFLAPPMRYKDDLSTRTGTLVWATLERGRPRTHVDRALRKLKARQLERASR